ncbi:Crp-like helix-turn-helix domain-containing protein [Chryseobacterium ureilyticum]|uniref:Crp-like helix-turn-helix domain-containing protein n=2 Tax=Chryseobacterium ureilyticum TaxID=373668 RepID=A0A1N7LBH6_9FLAO|nr:Crp-like helix-turn-helix domain-containing protein [Chryseobacterium ureilyticum]
MDYFKECAHQQERYSYEVPLTRQQIANLTGLCVETVIRTVKKMEQEELVKINGRHIMY